MIERCELAGGFSISRVLTGLWQIADMERDGGPVDPEEAAAGMRPYVEAGLTSFDMADHYGSSEEIVGRFLSDRADGAPIEVLTKWVPKPGPVTREGVRAAVELALARLRSERIDLFQFHAWSYADPAYLDCLFWLQELREEGLIGHLGLTNFDTAHLRIIIETGIEVVSNQVCFSLLDRRAARGMTELCLERGVKLLAYGTLAGGLLTERYRGQPEPAADELGSWSEMKYKRFLDVAGGWSDLQVLLAVLARIAERRGASIANVACRYVLDQPAVGGVIIGARLAESEHIRDNLRLFELALDEADRAEIDGALAGLEPIPGDSGDEYRKPPFLTAAGDLSDHFNDLPPPYEARDEEDGRTRVLSGTIWEDLAGFSRAVRRGDRILVSGTTATHGERAIGGSDPAAQTHFVVDKIEGALLSLGGRLEDVVRTRIFIREVGDWEAVTRVHGERFAHIKPANTLVQARLIGDEYLVEMEAEALIG